VNKLPNALFSRPNDLASVVKLRRTRRFVVGDSLGVLDVPPFKIRGDARRAPVAAGGVAKTGSGLPDA